MYIVIRLRSDAVDSLQKKIPLSPESEKLLKTIDDFGVVIKAMHPGSTDPLLAPYYLIEAPNQEFAEKIVNRLRTSAVVEAAYIKPLDEAP
jgi:hypothetical protein